MHYYKTTSGATGDRWKEGQRAWLSDVSTSFIRSGIDQKLHCLIRPTHSGVLTPAERPRDVEAEVGGQRQADAEIRGQRLADVRDQRSESQRGPESKSEGPRSAKLRPKLEDK